MTVVLGYAPTPEGAAALDHAIAEARTRDTRLVVVAAEEEPHLGRHRGHPLDLAALTGALEGTGIEHTVLHPAGDYDFAEEVLDAAGTHQADLIVIGVRRRTPVGKLLMAPPAQRILLEARCPVTAVKAAPSP